MPRAISAVPVTPQLARTRAPGARTLVLAVLGVATAAWLLMAWLTVRDGAGDPHGHSIAGITAGNLAADSPSIPTGHVHGTSRPTGEPSPIGRGPALGPFALLVAGWVLMVVAMMLPPALPMLDLLRRLVARQRHRRALVALAVFCFVAVWTAAAALLVAASAGLQARSGQRGWPDRGPVVATGLVLVGAGLYQFSPLKNACLRACRSPRAFAVGFWQGRRSPAIEVGAITLAYAVSCIGCCWALMAVCFAVGTAAALPVMVLLAAVMAAERLATWGQRLVRPVGVAAAALGLALAVGLLPAGLVTP